MKQRFDPTIIPGEETGPSRAKKWARIFYLILALLPIGAIIYLLFFTKYFAIDTTAVIDAREKTIVEVESMLNNFCNKNTYFWGQRNILLFNTKKAEQEILRDIPAIEEVRISRKLPGLIKATVKERVPVAVLVNRGEHYSLDKDGRVYEKVLEENQESVKGLPVIVNQSDDLQEIKLGETALSSRFMNFILKLISELLQRSSLKVVEFQIPSLASTEVHIKTEEGFLIYFDIERTAESQVNALERTLSEIIKEEERKKLEYIDLRIENKVYYK